MPPTKVTSPWEKLYELECRKFKEDLALQAYILREDPEKRGIERISHVCKELRRLSEKPDVIKEAALGMAEYSPRCAFVLKAPRKWLFSKSGDPDIAQACTLMECSLDRMALELRSDALITYAVAGHLRQMIEDIEKDFL
ncbi:uncharacterized protein N7529_007781 [Penicillium soppii]|uniref:uncharacterized protein n=1 Tax=Penicillium soppii TaxID=69789 RepID=UPI0025466EC4|nr:uncharacterized protein N7529_007781 [Penicillium soppii]KAJ5860471.1 hypothetical protein N7529_007781 [Penicillium soppii]